MRVSAISSLSLPVLATSNAVLPEPTSLLSLASTPRHTIALAVLTSSPTTATAESIIPIPTALPAQENLDLRAIIVDPNAPARPNAPAPLVTTQWLETKIDGIKTWVPVTITLEFAAVPQQASMPGKGEIGLGTLTGTVGSTRTLNMAMETGKAVWKRGALAAAGAAAIGLAI